jgi:chromosomal replication initiator protein
VTTSEREAVAALEQAIVQRIGEPRYTLWFARHTNFTRQDDLLVVGVPNLHFQDWLQNKFTDAVAAAATDVFGQPMRVRFSIDAGLFQAARRAQEEATNPKSEIRNPKSEKAVSDLGAGGSGVPTPESRRRSRRWRRLGDFVVGACNRVAHASAVSVVESPAQGANPLIIHGPVGTGKTHLLEGVYAGLRKTRTDWDVRFITAEEFTNSFVQAMRLGKLGGFRKRFRDCDALLVDDLHFLGGKRATQEEFLHTFDVLHAEGRQLVVTCDCHPRLTDDLSPELADRLLGGAVWGLTPPDAETRLAILRAHALRDSALPVPDEVLRFLAGQLRGNIRELEGALHSVRHYSRVAGRPVDLALAREALADLLRHAVRVVRLADVDAAVCRVLALDAGALQSKQRAWAVSHPRMLAMYLARKHTAAAYSEIGQHFGGRNHSTAVAAEKKVRQWLRDQGELAIGERRLRVRDVVELAERELLR